MPISAAVFRAEYAEGLNSSATSAAFTSSAHSARNGDAARGIGGAEEWLPSPTLAAQGESFGHPKTTL